MAKTTTNGVLTYSAIALLGLITSFICPSIRAADQVFPTKEWKTQSPATVGLDAKLLNQFARNVKGSGCIVKDGYLVAAWGKQDEKRDWASAAKPVLSTLLMFAISEGQLTSADALVKDAGWELAPKDQSMTYRHLANMVSGYACGEEPGKAWGYNDFGIQLYGLSLQKVFRQSLNDAAIERLAPLGLEDGSLFSSRDGLGVKTTPRDFARIGWLWLNRGKWRDRQLIPQRLFEQSARVGVPPDMPRTRVRGKDYLKIDSYGGSTNQTQYGPGVYGFNWWFNGEVREQKARVWPALPNDAYQANGMWNRDVVTVIPSMQMVVAFCGGDLGDFEPGKAAGEANQNMQLLVRAASNGK